MKLLFMLLLGPQIPHQSCAVLGPVPVCNKTEGEGSSRSKETVILICIERQRSSDQLSRRQEWLRTR